MVLPQLMTNPGEDILKTLVLVSFPGRGKTSAVCQLPNSLVIGLDDNYQERYGGTYFNLRKEAQLEGISLGRAYINAIQLVKDANSEAGKRIYDFIVLDNTTNLSELAYSKALFDYSGSTIGKGQAKKGEFAYDVTTDLGQNGWRWYQKAFRELREELVGLAEVSTIYLAHTTTKSIVKKDITLNEDDIDIPGKSKREFLAAVNAVGFMRLEGNRGIIRFSPDGDNAHKSSIQHLTGDIIISEMIDNKIVTYWERVFPGYFKP